MAIPRLFALVLCLILAGPVTRSQSYLDIAAFSYNYSPETAFEEGGQKTAVHHADLNFTLPIPTKGKTVLLTGLNAFSNRLFLDPDSPEQTGIYSVSILMGVRVVYRNDWSGTHYIIPRISSSFQAPRDGFQAATLQLLEKQRSENSSMGFGVYASKESYGWMLVPLFSFYYLHPDDLWEIRLFLPSRGDLNFRLTRRLRAGFFFDGLGSTHDIENELFGTSYVQRISNDLLGYVRFPLSKSLLLAVRAGYSFFRSYRVFDKDDTAGISIANFFFNDARTQLNRSVTDGFLFGVRLTYRVHF